MNSGRGGWFGGAAGFVKRERGGLLPVVGLCALLAYVFAMASHEWLSKEVGQLSRLSLLHGENGRARGRAMLPRFAGIAQVSDKHQVQHRVDELIDGYMAGLNSSRYSRENYLEALHDESCQRCFMVQIIDGSVYVADPRSLHIKGSKQEELRMREILFWFRQAAERAPHLKAEILFRLDMDIREAPKADRDKYAVPILGPAQCPHSGTIPFPASLSSLLRKHFPDNFTPDRGISLSGWDDQMLILMASNSMEWREKAPNVILRDRSVLKNRKRLKTARAILRVTPDTPLDTLATFQFITCMVDESGSWMESLPVELFSRSVVMKTHGSCQHFFEPLLVKNQHYIPITSIEDLPELVLGLRDNPGVGEIAENAMIFARDHLSFTGVLTYVETLLDRLAQLEEGSQIEKLPGSITYFAPAQKPQ